MTTPRIAFDNRYVTLPQTLYSRQHPTPVKAPRLVRINAALAHRLGIDPQWLASDEGLQVLAGNAIPEGADPLAAVYAGHQFGGWNPRLGDGRAILLGEVIGTDGQRYDIQLKGSGRTPYSRNGDGRSPLGPVLREYIISEAMAALGVPTTRSLAAIASGEPVVREQWLAGGVLTRVASSHVRVGTFQYFAAREDFTSLRALMEHVIERHYPHAASAEQPAIALLDAVIARQATLLAQWQALGFIHGVMNTDNMLVCGETIDYGPCAFLDEFNPDKVFSSIDQGGRYAYRNQPVIAQWNLMWLAQSLLPLMEGDDDTLVPAVQAALDRFVALHLEAYERLMLAKLGLAEMSEENVALIAPLLALMGDHALDYTLLFRTLAEQIPGASLRGTLPCGLLELPEEFAPWLQQWHAQLAAAGDTPEQQQARMLAHNPVFIPRNHQVEAAIAAAYEGDLQPFQSLVDVLAAPFDYDAALAQYAMPPKPQERVTRTFCGT